ncbi:MAG: PIN domain-containing protein [Treponema sp.]|nr:PIN domain-containing protein [Treponema sp.]MBP5695690.1 PIN domain-containing protein [Treponema sp.]MBR4245917.1 PIN domain-containing protein [Treponema sp.]
MTYFLDTNIISYLLKGDERLKAIIADKLLQGDKVMIPRVAYYEIERGLLTKGAISKMNRFKTWASLLGTVSLSDETLEIASQIYSDLSKKGLIIEDDDIFISATALKHNAVIVTNNENHLSRIENLKIENWTKG